MSDSPDEPLRVLDRAAIERVLSEVIGVRAEIVQAASNMKQELDRVHVGYQDSARNLLHYLALRRRDLRDLQGRLTALGLSSLGRAESHVLWTVDTVSEVLHRLAQRPWQPPSDSGHVDVKAGERLLGEHSQALFGPSPERGVRIMVTMPSEAAHDYSLVRELLKQGMDCMRINCAHDDVAAWSKMIEHLRRAQAEVGRSCRVSMDLAGPKLRTGPIDSATAVVRIRPRRDAYGRVVTPARIWLAAGTSPAPGEADACLRVPKSWLSKLRPGQSVHLTDARDAHRRFTIVQVGDDGCWAEATKTAYVVKGTVLSSEGSGGEEAQAEVGELPPDDGVIVLHEGDTLILTRELVPARAGAFPAGDPGPAVIGCTLGEIFTQVRANEAIWLDDGKIGGVIERVEADRLLIRITRTRASGAKLRADKGINLPDSDLRLSALTGKDLEDLAFVARHADIVALSFASSAEDVALLQRELSRYPDRTPTIVLKIETRRGFENLPEMLLAAMRMPTCGVMIARGDLAVECGFERLAEVQEEILWICEAAHIPVIWATQVLESLAKEGIASRAEISDAAMGHRAECVMLNKGPHVVRAVSALDDILRRMQAHQIKKRAMLRELRLAHVRPLLRTGSA